MSLPDFEWNTDHLPEDKEAKETDIEELKINCGRIDDLEKSIKEIFGDKDIIQLDPIPIQNNSYGKTTPFDFPRAVLCYLQEKSVETVKIEMKTKLTYWKDEWKPPKPVEYVWYGWEDQLKERDSFQKVKKNLINQEDPPEWIKREKTLDDDITVWKRNDYSTGTYVETPEDAFEVIQEFFDPSWRKERSGVIFLDENNQVVRTRILNKGSKKQVSLPSSFEMNNLVEKYGAKKVISVHNHPNGEARPSERDKESYKIFKDEKSSGLMDEQLEAEFFDKMIVGNYPNSETFTGYYSFRENFDQRDLEETISPAIKIDWQGKAREKAKHWLETRAERNERETNVFREYKTKIVVRKVEDAEELLFLTSYRKRKKYAFWDDNEKLLKSVRRIRQALINKLKERGYKVEDGNVLAGKYS